MGVRFGEKEWKETLDRWIAGHNEKIESILREYEVPLNVAVRTRKGRIDLPVGIAFEMDVELMAGWPKDLFQKAFRMVWERFAYRRLPEVADFFRYIELDLGERRQRRCVP